MWKTTFREKEKLVGEVSQGSYRSVSQDSPNYNVSQFPTNVIEISLDYATGGSNTIFLNKALY